MEPRHPTSAKWTPFPADLVETIQEVFAEKFTAESVEGEFIVDGRIYAQEILLRIGFLPHGRIQQLNFEASMEFNPDEEKGVFKSIFAAVNSLGGVFEDYFDTKADTESDDESDDLGAGFDKADDLTPGGADPTGIDFPRNWQSFDTEEGTVYMQYSTVNTKLEAEADRLLKADTDKALVYEESVSDDALSRAVVDTDLAFEIQSSIRKSHEPH